MRISDWSSDVCSSDLVALRPAALRDAVAGLVGGIIAVVDDGDRLAIAGAIGLGPGLRHRGQPGRMADDPGLGPMLEPPAPPGWRIVGVVGPAVAKFDDQGKDRKSTRLNSSH